MQSNMTHENRSLERARENSAEEILGQKFPVLDDGFVRLVDYMGTDASIVQAARVSYGAGTKILHEDEGLIRYLMRHQHTTPFEMCELKLHIRVPIDCWRQWVRHRTANINEYSTRYSIAVDSAQHTLPNEWRLQSTSNKQGSSQKVRINEGIEISEKERNFLKTARKLYQSRIDAGVAREQARKDLPLSTYTEAYWKIDLHNLLHFLALRMDSHAQQEIRAYATVIGHDIVSKWCPIAWQAFLDYRMNSLLLTAREITIVQQLSQNSADDVIEIAKEFGWINKDGTPSNNRERKEAEEKFSKLAIQIPWISN